MKFPLTFAVAAIPLIAQFIPGKPVTIQPAVICTVHQGSLEGPGEAHGGAVRWYELRLKS